MVAQSIVRLAEPADYGEVWRLLMLAFKENARFSLAPEKVHWHVQRALYPLPPGDTGPRCAIGVIGDYTLLEGLAFLSTGNFWYTHEQHIEEFLVFVDPSCRRSFHAKALIDWMKACSDQNGMKLLTGVISNVRTEAKVRLYQRMVPKIGAFFLYKPEAMTRASSSEAA